MLSSDCSTVTHFIQRLQWLWHGCVYTPHTVHHSVIQIWTHNIAHAHFDVHLECLQSSGRLGGSSSSIVTPSPPPPAAAAAPARLVPPWRTIRSESCHHLGCRGNTFAMAASARLKKVKRKWVFICPPMRSATILRIDTEHSDPSPDPWTPAAWRTGRETLARRSCTRY